MVNIVTFSQPFYDLIFTSLLTKNKSFFEHTLYRYRTGGSVSPHSFFSFTIGKHLGVNWQCSDIPEKEPCVQIVPCTGHWSIHTPITVQRRIPDKDAFHRARNLCVFSRVQKGTPGLTHEGCVLQRVSLDAVSDVTVVLGMRQSIVEKQNGGCYTLKDRG